MILNSTYTSKLASFLPWERQWCSGLAHILGSKESGGSSVRLATTISEIGYLLLPSPNMTEIMI